MTAPEYHGPGSAETKVEAWIERCTSTDSP